MKHIILFFAFLITLNTFAQHEKRQEKIRVLKVGYLTKKLDLTTEEAQQFWPIYNAFEHKNAMLRNNLIKRQKKINLEELSEAEALKIIKNYNNNTKKKAKLQEQLIVDLQGILSSKKIIKLLFAEHEFRNEMIKRFKGLHRPKDNR